jgi:hypothetical protein
MLLFCQLYEACKPLIYNKLIQYLPSILPSILPSLKAGKNHQPEPAAPHAAKG